MTELNRALLRMVLAGLAFLFVYFVPEIGFFSGHVYSLTILLFIILILVLTPYRPIIRHLKGLGGGSEKGKEK